MPQLAPGPWFFMFFILWLIITLITPTKILNYNNLNAPNPKTHETPHNPWTWPWQ